MLAALACNLPGRAPATEAAPTPTASQAEKVSPTPQSEQPTSTPQVAQPIPTSPPPTDTPVPGVTGPGGCIYNAVYVADVTVPDDSPFPPGAAFTKTWRVRNSGTCEWKEGVKLVYVSGDPLGGPVSVNVPAAAAGANADISVAMVAPSTPGTYRSNWQLQNSDSVRFGNQIYVQIVVTEPPTPTPTATASPTPSPTPTETPTGAPAGPDLYISELSISPASPQSGDTIQIRVGTYNQGDQAAGAYKVTFRYGPQPWNVCSWDVPGTNARGGRILTCDALVYSEYTGVATTDVDNTVTESDETNNVSQLAISIPAATGVDLYISEMSITPANPHAGDTVTARIGIYNRGAAPAGAFRVYWRYWTGDFDVCDWGVDSLSARGGRILECSVTLPGSYDTVATADAKADIAESVETNNNRTLHVDVAP
jgi:hypothetical protein